MIKHDCPKCGSPNAWIELSEFDKTLRCMCGLCKVIETKLESFVITHNDSTADVKLPRKNTSIWFTLMALAREEVANSAEVTKVMVQLGYDFTVSDVSSYLTILRSKGLVLNIDVKRGVPGGSTWTLSDPCKELLML